VASKRLRFTPTFILATLEQALNRARAVPLAA